MRSREKANPNLSFCIFQHLRLLKTALSMWERIWKGASACCHVTCPCCWLRLPVQYNVKDCMQVPLRKIVWSVAIGGRTQTGWRRKIAQTAFLVCKNVSRLRLCVPALLPSFFPSPVSLFLPSCHHFIPLASSAPIVLLPWLLFLPFQLHFSSLILWHRHHTCPSSRHFSNLFLGFFFPLLCFTAFPPSSSSSSLPADSHMQLCKWQDAVWLWCGLAVVCLHCHCGSFCLPACCFTLSGPGRLPGWLDGRMVDWLLHNWGGRAIACKPVTNCYKLSCRHRDAGQPSESRLPLCFRLNAPCCLKFSDNTTKCHLSRSNGSLQKTGQLKWLTWWLMVCVSPPDGSCDILCGAEDTVCIRMWWKSVYRLHILAYTVPLNSCVQGDINWKGDHFGGKCSNKVMW